MEGKHFDSLDEKEKADDISHIPVAYHAIILTHNKRPLFTSTANCNNLAYLIFETAILHKYSLYAFCIMYDHVHILCRPGDLIISHFVNLLRFRYEYVQYKVGRKEPIWQPEYKEYPIVEEDVVDTALFILNNPVRKGLVKLAKDYPHSFAYGGKEYRP